MTPAFGFSVGDFISAIGLVKRISKSLKEIGGASTEYQLVFIELKGLENILQHLQNLEPTEYNVTHVNAIRGMALACQLPLRDFMVKLEKYESTLGPFADKRSLRATVRKSKWAVVFAEEVERLRAMVAAKNISLSLLLSMNTSQTLSHMNSRNEEKHSDLMSKAAEHRAALHGVKERVIQVEERIFRAEVTCDHRLDVIEDKMSQAGETSKRRFDEVGFIVEETQASVMSLRSTGEQLLRCLRTFPQEMRELLQNILRGNWQMYQVLLKIQQSMSRSPTGLLDSNIRFEDAMGEYRELPYEFFRHWEPFEGFLRAQFKDKLGEKKVIEGQYHIIDVENGRNIIKKEHWTRSIERGARLTMSMVMSYLQRRADSCPRPSCPGGGVNQCPVSDLLSCQKCNLKFYPRQDDLEVWFRRTEEEEEVARRQNDEDLRLYGNRLEPMDALEVDLETKSSDPRAEVTTTDFESASDGAGKAHKKNENISDDNEALAYYDRSTEVNPMFTWLTESALPSVVPTRSHPLDQSEGTEVDLVKEETKEIEVFRYVHVASDPRPEGHARDTIKAENILGLKLPSQVYYRNIVDRYPLLPTYLARRLAEANTNRAKRLSRQRVEAMAKAKIVTSRVDKTPRTTKGSGAGTVYGFDAHENEGQETARGPLSRSGIRTGKKKPPSETQRKSISPRGITQGPPFHYKRLKADKKRAESYASLSESQPQYDYWSGKSSSYRTKSVGTRSSSRNSSLHGSPKFCHHKQYQNVDYFASSPTQYHYSSPSLPPPPVKFHKQQPSKRKPKRLSFDCGICGENIKVDKRRQWQKHVMRDLRPYICTAQECDRAAESFPSLVRYLTHEIEAHELCPLECSSARIVDGVGEESIVCIFCGERTEAGRGGNARGRHVGRHMEEIAFIVVPKAYEEWEFYSEFSSSSANSYERPRPAHWDPNEEPFLILGSVFDANSLGKWIYDWTAFCYGARKPGSDLAGDLWLLMIRLAQKKKRIEDRSLRLMNSEDEEFLDVFLARAESLWSRLKKLLKACEGYMLKTVKKESKMKLGKESGREFVDTMFGRRRKLEVTEELMLDITLWIRRFDARCDDMLRTARPRANLLQSNE